MNEDKATRYHRFKRHSRILATVWSVLLLVGLLLTGGSVWIREFATAIADATVPAVARPAVIVATYVGVLFVLNEIGRLPLNLYGGFVIERRYGLSTLRLGEWLVNELKSFAVGLVVGVAAASVVYFFLRRAPEYWWLPTGVAFAAGIVGLANLGPVLLLPLFYSVKPLTRESLRVRLIALADRAGARVLGAYEWGLGRETTRANAALTGLGASRRILLSDTMLAEYSDEEIEVVLAHELAHHVHGDIWKGLVFEAGLTLLGFLAAARALPIGVERFGLLGEADVAGVPVLLLVAGAVSLALVPAAHAMSRDHERRADRFALNLTQNPAAFIAAMRRMGAQNLAEEDPSRLVQWLFYNHPTVRDRIAVARRFSPTRLPQSGHRE